MKWSVVTQRYGLRQAPLPVPEVNSGTFTPGFGAPTPKLLRG